jgi:hypothetical protein
LMMVALIKHVQCSKLNVMIATTIVFKTIVFKWNEHFLQAGLICTLTEILIPPQSSLVSNAKCLREVLSNVDTFTSCKMDKKDANKSGDGSLQGGTDISQHIRKGTNPKVRIFECVMRLFARLSTTFTCGFPLFLWSSAFLLRVLHSFF